MKVDEQAATIEPDPLGLERERVRLAAGTGVDVVPLSDLPSVIVDASIPSERGPDAPLVHDTPPSPEAVEIATWSALDAADDLADRLPCLPSITVGAQVRFLVLTATVLLTVLAGMLAISIV